MASFANLTEQICCQNELMIVATKNLELKNYIKGHHVYKVVWTPVVGEVLQVEMEPNNLVEKYAVCTRKDGQVVEHLKKGLTGRFAKTIFYFLRGESYSQCSAKIVGSRCNLGDGEGLQMPCELHILGQKRFVERLKEELSKLKEV